jgi:hypothetical protein
VIVILLPAEFVAAVVGAGSPAAIAGGGERRENVETISTDRSLQIRCMALLEIASFEASVGCNFYLFYWCRLRGINVKSGVILDKPSRVI